VTEKVLRILLLGDSRAFHIERYVPELVRQNCEVKMVSVEDGDIEHVKLRRHGPIRQLHYTLAARQLNEIVDEYKPGVVDVQDANYGYMAALALKGSNIPVHLQILGSDILIAAQKTFLHRKKTVKALVRADAVTADSQYLLNEAQRLAPLKLTMVDPFGIEERNLRFHKSNYRLSRPLKIIVPRLQDTVYNNPFIVKALAPLLCEGTIELRFADFGPRAAEFRALLRELNYPNVHLYQKDTRDAFLKLMSEHDVFLSASLSDSSPVSLIEAMALGLIPVVADIPGVKEWAEQGRAFRFSKERPDELTSIIRDFAVNDNHYSEMRRSNLARVKEMALFENNVRARIEMMQKILR
jgi:glycosyltransferase involved in cell wall biosynthesis